MYTRAMADRFKAIVAVHLFFIQDNQVLLLRRFNTGYQDGNYSVPAGHLDGNETAVAPAIREGQEEVGVELKPEDLECVHVMHRMSDEERVDFFFVVKNWPNEPLNCEPDKCDELKWFPLDKLPKNVVPYVRAALQAVQRKEHFSLFGWDTIQG